MITRVIDILNFIAWLAVYGTIIVQLLRSGWRFITVLRFQAKNGNYEGGMNLGKWFRNSLWLAFSGAIIVVPSLGWLYISGDWTP